MGKSKNDTKLLIILSNDRYFFDAAIINTKLNEKEFYKIFLKIKKKLSKNKKTEAHNYVVLNYMKEKKYINITYINNNHIYIV